MSTAGMPEAGAIALLAFFSAAVRVEGATSCPPPDLVAARLRGLVAATAAGDKPDRARLWEEDGDLIVLLESADGVLIGTRRLPRTYACEDLAFAAAVAVADWESDIHPEFAPVLTTRARPVAPIDRAVPAQIPLPPPQPWMVSVGVALALGGSVDKPAEAGAALIGAWLARAGWRSSLRADVVGQSEQQVSLQTGSAAWRRWTFGLGIERPLFGTGEGGGWLRGFAQARLAWLDMRGAGFTLNRTDGTLDPGTAVGVRAVTSRGRWTPWAELAASWWPVRHTVRASGIGDVGQLPAVEGFVRIGLALTSAR